MGRRKCFYNRRQRRSVMGTGGGEEGGELTFFFCFCPYMSRGISLNISQLPRLLTKRLLSFPCPVQTRMALSFFFPFLDYHHPAPSLHVGPFPSAHLSLGKRPICVKESEPNCSPGRKEGRNFDLTLHSEISFPTNNALSIKF